MRVGRLRVSVFVGGFQASWQAVGIFCLGEWAGNWTRIESMYFLLKIGDIPSSYQWLFLAFLKGGRWHIIPQLAVYTTYIPLIYCLLGGYMLPTTF